MRVVKAFVAAALLTIPASISHAGSNDLLSKADETGKFFVLLEAAELAGLTGKLKGDGPFTVFAPTDAAFNKLDPEFVDYLSQPENKDELLALLKMHIVPGKMLAADLKSATEPLSTLLDTRLQVDTTNGLRVANAQVTATDMVASNGVIHTIDAIIEKHNL